jgi:acyl dehydratase
MDRLYFEDFPPGKTFEYGAREVTAEEIVEFAREFDPQPFHLDEAAARETMAGGLIASGWHSAALMMRINCDELFLRSSAQGSPGLASIDWLKPVRPGDRLSVRSTTLGARPSRSRPDVGLVEMRFELMNQNREVVLRQQGAVFFGRRPDSEPQQ